MKLKFFAVLLFSLTLSSSVYADRLFLMKNNQLFSFSLFGDTVNNRVLIDSGGWYGELAVSSNYIYLMRDGDLHSWRLDGNSLVDQKW